VAWAGRGSRQISQKAVACAVRAAQASTAPEGTPATVSVPTPAVAAPP
jgi:hypothetical protein